MEFMGIDSFSITAALTVVLTVKQFAGLLFMGRFERNPQELLLLNNKMFKNFVVYGTVFT